MHNALFDYLAAHWDTVNQPKAALRLDQTTDPSQSRWLAQYGGMNADDAKRLKELDGENARAKTSSLGAKSSNQG